MASLSAHSKLINESNKMIKQLINSSKDINKENIEYIIFHKHGICTALLDPSLSKGEVLILSRLLNLIFNSNLLSLSDFADGDFGKLLLSLLSGLKNHKNHYFWITALSILNQQSAIEFLSQSKQMIKEIRKIFTDSDPEAIKIVRSTLINISNFIIKLLEQILSNIDNINISIILVTTRLSCYLVMHLVDDTGLSGPEISVLTQHLFTIYTIVKSTSNQSFILKEEVLIILKKLNTDNVLNLVSEVILFINHFLPYISLHFDQINVIQLLCKCCYSLLQRTANPHESVQIIKIAWDIINFGSQNGKSFLHDESNVKSLMGFIKILPNTVEHSDARNILWWHILCSLLPHFFQSKFKTYFVPFLENILGAYLDQNNVSYGLSEFSLAKGCKHLSLLANHIFINILDIIDFDSDLKMNLLDKNINSSSIQLLKLSSDSFIPDILESSEYMGFVFNAIEIWTQILENQRRQHLSHLKPKETQKIVKCFPKRKSLPIKEIIKCRIKKKYIKKRNLNNKNSSNYSNDRLSLTPSSDDTAIRYISDESPENNKQNNERDDNEYDNPAIPEIAMNLHLTKPKIREVNKANVTKSPRTSTNLFDLQNILDFFKFRTNPNSIKRHSSDNNTVANMDQKRLPLKKRKIDHDPGWFTNPTIKNGMNSCVNRSPKNVSSQSDVNTTDDECSFPKNRHKYFIRSNPYGVNDNTTYSKHDSKTSGKGRLTRSNVDFSVNVSETSKQPKCCDHRFKKNKSNSKKVEFKIKFDLNPLSKMCSEGIKLDIIKNKCQRHHSATPECKLIKG